MNDNGIDYIYSLLNPIAIHATRTVPSLTIVFSFKAIGLLMRIFYWSVYTCRCTQQLSCHEMFGGLAHFVSSFYILLNSLLQNSAFLRSRSLLRKCEVVILIGGSSGEEFGDMDPAKALKRTELLNRKRTMWRCTTNHRNVVHPFFPGAQPQVATMQFESGLDPGLLNISGRQKHQN